MSRNGSWVRTHDTQSVDRKAEIRRNACTILQKCMRDEHAQTRKGRASVRNASHNANRSPEIRDRQRQADYRSLENRAPSLRKRSFWQPFARKYVQYAYRCSEMSGCKQHRSDTCPCRTCEPFVGKKPESTDLLTEIPSARCHQHRARHRNRSHEIGCGTRRVCWKFMPQSSFKFRYVSRSPEMRPKIEDAQRKRSHDLNGNRPAPEACQTPRGPSL